MKLVEPNMIQEFVADVPEHTLFFIALISLFILYFHIRFTEKAINLAPTILTTLGIFATFAAIAYGLHGFDTRNVAASVPALLDGLKTAFWASVAGVGGALSLKLRQYFSASPSNQQDNDEDEVSGKDLLETLKGIHWSLAGEQDSTLVSQIKLMRTDINDRLDILKKAQEESLQKLSEMGSKEIIKALESVIRDFNDKITEQFGENFQRLNEAVEKLLIWQDNYKSHIEATEERHQAIVSSMGTATTNYTELLHKADGFSRVSNDLSGMLSKLEEQKQTLEKMLTSLGELLSTANGAIPNFESKIVEIANQIKVSAEEQQKIISSAITENSTTIQRSIESTIEQNTRLHEAHSSQISDLTKKAQDQIEVLDRALSEELQKSLESLGRQLTALSNKFVEDYTPLTDRLRQLVSQVSKVQ